MEPRLKMMQGISTSVDTVTLMSTHMIDYLKGMCLGSRDLSKFREITDDLSKQRTMED